MSKRILSFLFCAVSAVLFGQIPEHTWSGYPGAAKAPPEVRVLEDSQVSGAVCIEATDAGAYQGATLRFSSPVKLSDYKGLEFSFRQNMTGGKIALQVRFEQTEGVIYTITVIESSTQWCKVYVPFDAAKFTPQAGRPVVFGTSNELRLQPSASMNAVGHHMEIGDLRLVPGEVAAAAAVAEEKGAAEVPPVAESDASAEVAPHGGKWLGYKGGAMIPPKAVKFQDAKVGSAIRVEAVEDGIYQGALLQFPEAVNLAEYEGLEFSFRQNLTRSKVGLQARFEQKRGMVYTSVVIPQSHEWCKVYVPFDAAQYTPETGNTVVFDKCHEIRFSPYGALNKKGLHLEFANLRFVPRRTGPVPLHVAVYTHRCTPTSGDSGGTALIDGDLKNNVFFRAYSEEPDIEFDLGARYALDEMKVEAFAAPSHNFDSIEIFASDDQKNWVSAGTLRNALDGIDPVAMQCVFTPAKKAVGRYLRLKFSRKRSDFAVNISEISFKGHVPSAEEIVEASLENYDTGKAMAPRTAKDYALLSSGPWKLWVSRSNGVVNGVFYKGKLLVERLSARYTVQTRQKDTEISGYDDVVKGLSSTADSVVFTVTNPKLPGVSIRRTWRVDGNTLREKNEILNERQDRFFLRVATEVILEKDFRKDGFYEMPGSALAFTMYRLGAEEVTSERAMTNIPNIVFENGVRNLTLWHTRHYFNDRFTYMDVGTEEENLQYYRANGWLLTGATVVPADKPVQSFENFLSITEGRLLDAFDEYIARPEVHAYRSQFKRASWLRDLRMLFSLGWDANYPSSTPRHLKNYLTGYSRRGYIYEPEALDTDGIWGDWLTEGPVRGSWGELHDATEIREKLEKLHAVDPRLKFGLYSWWWSAFPWSTPVKNHPEWFVKTLRNGAPASWFPQVNTNYLRFWGIPESREEAINQIGNAVKYYKQAGWYADGGKCGVYAKDWDTMRIDDPLGQTDFYLGVRKRIQQDNPESVICFNHSENLVGDMGYLETFGGTLTNEWRRGADLMWKFKLYSYKDPLHQPSYTYWVPGVDVVFHNYLAGVATLPAMDCRDFYTKDIPFICARYEIRFCQLTEAHVLPDWRFDLKENLECMALRQQNNGWIFMQNHDKDVLTRDVSGNLAALGMTQKDRPVYAWLYTIRNANKYLAKFAETAQEKAYGETGWVSERAALPQYLGAFPWSERFARTISFQPGEAKVLMFSQIPAVVRSIENDPVHYDLSGQIGVELTEENGAIVVNSEFQDAEVGLILPAGKMPETVLCNGEAAAFRIHSDGAYRLAVVHVPRGKSTLQMQCVSCADAVVSSLEVSLQGKTLSVKVIPEDAQTEIRSEDGELCLSHRGSFALCLPETVRDGQYVIRAGTQTKTIALKGFGKPMKVLPILVALPVEKQVSPVGRKVNGIEVLNQGTAFNPGSTEAVVDSSSLKLKAGTLPRYDSHFNSASAAVEIRTKRYVRLRITNGFLYHSRYAYMPSRQFVRAEHPGALAGLVLDFSENGKYTTRCVAGFGQQTEARKKGQPDPVAWGTQKPPQRVFILNRVVYDPKTEVIDGWVDLAELGAPAAWDGRLWLTVQVQHAAPDRSFTVEILQTADALPAGAEVQKPSELGAAVVSRTYPVRRITGKPDWGKLPVLGTLLPGGPLSEPLKTTVRAAYDDGNIYLRYECKEKKGHIITAYGKTTGKPWEGDGIEFLFALAKEPDMGLHAIIDASNAHYVEHAPMVNMPGKKRVTQTKTTIRHEVHLGKEEWSADVTIPWAEIGGKPAAGRKVAFNLMRNRLEQGNIGDYALGGDGKYFSGNAFLLELK